MGKNVEKKDQVNTLRDLITKEGFKKQLKMVLPQYLTEDRLIRIALNAFQKNPKLFQCSQNSILKAIMDAAQVGLEPDGIHAHLVPYWNRNTRALEMQFQADYKGFIDLAREYGVGITAQSVRENDKFEFEYGNNKYLKHQPRLKDRGELVGAYSFAEFKDGAFDFIVLGDEEILKAKNCSQSKGEGSVWEQWPDAMYAKTAVRRHAKFLPQAPKLQQAAAKDEAVDFGIDVQPPEKIETKTQEKTDNLKKRLSGEEEQAPEKPQESNENNESYQTTEEVPDEPQHANTWLQQHEGVKVENISDRSGETKGKKWTKFTLHTSKGKFSTFDTKVVDYVKENEGSDFFIVASGKYNAIEEIRAGDSSE